MLTLVLSPESRLEMCTREDLADTLDKGEEGIHGGGSASLSLSSSFERKKKLSFGWSGHVSGQLKRRGGGRC